MGASSSGIKGGRNRTDTGVMATPGGRQQRLAVERSLPAGGRVLLVGQNPLLLHALQRILEADGHETLLCEMRREACAELGRANLDVAVLDLDLGLGLDAKGQSGDGLL